MLLSAILCDRCYYRLAIHLAKLCVPRLDRGKMSWCSLSSIYVIKSRVALLGISPRGTSPILPSFGGGRRSLPVLWATIYIAVQPLFHLAGAALIIEILVGLMWGDYISVLGDFPTWGNPHTGFTLLMAGLPLRHFPFVTCGIPFPCRAAFILAGGIAFLMAGLQRPKSRVAVLGDFPMWGNPHTGFTFLMAGLQRPKSRVAVLGDFPTWGNPHTGFTFLMAGLQRPKSRVAVLGDFPTWGNPHTGGTPPSFVIGHVRDSPHRIPYLGEFANVHVGNLLRGFHIWWQGSPNSGIFTVTGAAVIMPACMWYYHPAVIRDTPIRGRAMWGLSCLVHQNAAPQGGDINT